MLNWVLAAIAGALWSTAYGWYFSPDLRHGLWWWRNRRQLAEAERARAYAAWMRRPAPRRRQPCATSPQAAEPPHMAPLQPSATVIAFPGSRHSAARR